MQEESQGLGEQVINGLKRGVQDECEISNLGAWVLVRPFSKVKKSTGRADNKFKHGHIKFEIPVGYFDGDQVAVRFGNLRKSERFESQKPESSS